jgi:hypothetical protein
MTHPNAPNKSGLVNHSTVGCHGAEEVNVWLTRRGSARNVFQFLLLLFKHPSSACDRLSSAAVAFKRLYEKARLSNHHLLRRLDVNASIAPMIACACN